MLSRSKASYLDHSVFYVLSLVQSRLHSQVCYYLRFMLKRTQTFTSYTYTLSKLGFSVLLIDTSTCVQNQTGTGPLILWLVDDFSTN